jgi:phosphohistidine phosphatase
MVEVGTRTLIILRHAKAANPEGVVDQQRPLSPRGERDAAAAGGWLVEHGLQPDVVLCSPAKRTRQTWHRVASILTRAPDVSYVEQLYAAGVPDLLDALANVSFDARVVLLIGHNPALSQLSALLDPSGADAEGLSTSGIAVHSWEGEWSDAGAGAAPLSASHTARG